MFACFGVGGGWPEICAALERTWLRTWKPRPLEINSLCISRHVSKGRALRSSWEMQNLPSLLVLMHLGSCVPSLHMAPLCRRITKYRPLFRLRTCLSPSHWHSASSQASPQSTGSGFDCGVCRVERGQGYLKQKAQIKYEEKARLSGHVMLLVLCQQV